MPARRPGARDFSNGWLMATVAGRRRADGPRARSRCRNIKLVVTNQVQYDHRWSHRSRSCTAVGIWSTKLTTWEGGVGRQRSDPRSEDGTGRMERAVVPSCPCRVLGTLGYRTRSFSAGPPSVTFLSSCHPLPPSYLPGFYQCRVKNAVSGEDASQQTPSVRVESQSRASVVASPRAIRYTPLRRQLRTMDRATGKKKER